jgi:hypothetical protein
MGTRQIPNAKVPKEQKAGINFPMLVFADFFGVWNFVICDFSPSRAGECVLSF